MGDTVLAVVLPPVAFYRTFEMFWHTDSRALDRDPRAHLAIGSSFRDHPVVQRDIRDCCQVMGSAGNMGTDSAQSDERAVQLGARIAQHPQAVRDFLEVASTKWLEFACAMEDDVARRFDACVRGEATQESEQLRLLRVGFQTFCSINIINTEIEEASQALENLIAETLSQFTGNATSEQRNAQVSIFLYQMKAEVSAKKARMKAAHRLIFPAAQSATTR